VLAVISPGYVWILKIVYEPSPTKSQRLARAAASLSQDSGGDLVLGVLKLNH
jgi:hypothetical protein